jgi:hypothetical protein
MVWLVLVGILGAALLFGRAALSHGASGWWPLVVLLVPGFWQSLQTALPEPIATAFLLGGYLALRSKRWLAAGVLFAASLLVRETGIVLILLWLAWRLLTGQRRGTVVVACVAFAPLLLWRVYVGLVLFPAWGWGGFYASPQDLGLPLAGFIDLWRAVERGEYLPAIQESAYWYPLVLIAAFVLSLVFIWHRPSAVNVAAAVYAIIAISLNYEKIWVHVGNGQRGTYEVFVMLALSSMAQPRSRAVLACAALFWALTAWYVFFGAFDARLIRSAILPAF